MHDAEQLTLFDLPVLCSIPDCDRTVIRVRGGLCQAHYTRKWRYGDPLAGGPMRPKRQAPAKAVRDFPDGTRICSNCEQRLPLELFHKDSGNARGRRSRCATCERELAAGWYQAHRERQSARELARRNANLEMYRERDRERYLRHREKRIALANQQSHKRRLRMLDGEYDKSVTRGALRKQYGDGCFYCGQQMDFARYTHSTRPENLATIEHVWPISKGGGHTWDNVVLACLRCNITKNCRTPEEWEAA